MTFNIRDREQGVNMDFMTYSMYNLVNKDPTALLNATTLATMTEKTFQTFFQHFVSSNVSITEGGRAYQPIGKTMGDIGALVRINRTRMRTQMPAQYSADFPVLNTNRSATAQVSTRIDILYMSPIATWLSISIIIWLLGTTVTVAVLQRSYLKSLNSDFETFADVLVCICGSENLLELVKERGVEGLKEVDGVVVRLGWFRDGLGRIRYGIEAEGR